jgi:membrane-bound lytic murein transglycosylase B
LIKSLALAATLLLACSPLAAKTPDQLREAFIDEMVSEHGFDRDEVRRTLYQAHLRKPILEAISRPAERRLNWTEYRDIFLTQSRIDGGVQFWRDNVEALEAAERQFGVPPQIIVAILGVETRYGGFTGGHRVLDALHTLGFHYPRRGPFFREQLSHFLRFAREEGIDPTYPTGSYAGAMGVPQFMPDSFRIYAIDFDGDGRRDIWENPRDVIGSVANYFVEKGKWQLGQPVTSPAQGVQGSHQAFLDAGARPSLGQGPLIAAGIRSDVLDGSDAKVSLIALETNNGDEHWVARDNFFAIMRYNPRTKYAMAVFQLSEAILAAYRKQAG